MTGRGIFISHSSADGDGAAELRAAVAELLGGPDGRGYDVLLDEIELRPGDAWRPKLYRWLAECGGAVLVLTPEALRSPWVRKEADILSWRRALLARRDVEMTVVPVLLGGVTKAEVNKAFPAVYLDELQFLPVTLDGVEATKKVAEAIANRFPVLRPFGDDDLQTWAEEIGSWLEHIDDPFLRQASQQLSVGNDWTHDGAWTSKARCLNLADSLIHAPFREVARALTAIIRSGAPTRRLLVESLILTCVPSDSAAAVLSAMRHQEDHVVVVNTGHTQTAERLVRRAICDRRVLTVGPPDPVETEREEPIYDSIVQAIANKVGMNDLRPEDLAYLDEPLVLLLRARSAADEVGDGFGTEMLRGLLARLRAEFDTVIVVLLGRSASLDRERLGVDLLWRVDPPLDGQEERQAMAGIKRLLDQLEPAAREESYR